MDTTQTGRGDHTMAGEKNDHAMRHPLAVHYSLWALTCMQKYRYIYICVYVGAFFQQSLVAILGQACRLPFASLNTFLLKPVGC